MIIELYNVPLALFLLACTITAIYLIKALKQLKRFIGKTIIKLEKAGVL